MKAYFIRRLLLVPITLLGVTAIVFSLTRIMPGSPMEQAMQAQNAGEEGSKGSSDGPQGGMNEDDLEKMEEQFDYDKSIPVAYLNWLGALPRENTIIKKELAVELLSFDSESNGVVTLERRGSKIVSAVDLKSNDLLKNSNWKFDIRKPGDTVKGEIGEEQLKGFAVYVTEPKGNKPKLHKFSAASSVTNYVDKSTEARLVVFGSGQTICVKVDENNPSQVESVRFLNSEGKPEDEGWTIEVQTPLVRKEAAVVRYNLENVDKASNYEYRVKIYKKEFNGLLQGSFGQSVKYGDDVIDMIFDRVPVAMYFGILSTLIIYSVCIPLGIVKAIKHRSLMDNTSSILIFVGYSIPGFAFGALLLVYLGARMGWFPLFGLMSEDADSLSTWGKLVDLAHHTVLPLAAYIISGFAAVTMMMKNNLMDNLSADYVRTAVAKGVSFKAAVFKHAFRNSFIPIATGLGGLVTIFVSGSLLVERVFDIQGFGMLSFTAVEQRDQTVIMGTLTISAFLMIIGNILSDVIVALVDPRIKFSK